MIVAYWAIGDEHLELAHLSANSVLGVYPNANIVIDTHRAPGRPMMVANLDAQIRVLQSAKEGDHVLFLDTDTLLRKPFPLDWNDLIVTWRDSIMDKEGEKVEGVTKLMPYNYGVIGVLASHTTLEAFYWMRARILAMAPMYQDWYGNQLALAELCAAPMKPHGERIRHIKWSYMDIGTPLHVKYLPCDVYNYTPEAAGEDVSDKVVIHLKGHRKHLMEAYAI